LTTGIPLALGPGTTDPNDFVSICARSAHRTLAAPSCTFPGFRALAKLLVKSE
jgi:hypothetical protein